MSDTVVYKVSLIYKDVNVFIVYGDTVAGGSFHRTVHLGDHLTNGNYVWTVIKMSDRLLSLKGHELPNENDILYKISFIADRSISLWMSGASGHC